jgi:nitroimidazol reductase NimA-like FMN-containing flavoprotein (pyridoxamine 5'-phosphate oxidase superfamily)
VNPTEPIETLARIQEASFARAGTATRGAFPAERRMTGPELTAFLSRKRYGVLASVRPDGRPHAAPVGFALVGTRFVMASLSDAQRVRNLRHEPHATLVVSEEEGDKHAVVIAEGTARLLEPLEASLDMRAPFRDEAGALPDWVGVIIALTAERVLSYAAAGYGAE